VNNRPDLSDDGVLLGLLSAALDDQDPVPAAAVSIAAAAGSIGRVDGELADLVNRSVLTGSGVMLRDEADVTALTFVAPRLTIEIEVDSDRRVTGVISPPISTVVAVETCSPQSVPLEGITRSDEFGRFQLFVAVGLCRLRLGGDSESVFTSWFYT
jgi:hypothetical protein